MPCKGRRRKAPLRGFFSCRMRASGAFFRAGGFFAGSFFAGGGRAGMAIFHAGGGLSGRAAASRSSAGTARLFRSCGIHRRRSRSRYSLPLPALPRRSRSSTSLSSFHLLYGNICIWQTFYTCFFGMCVSAARIFCRKGRFRGLEGRLRALYAVAQKIASRFRVKTLSFSGEICYNKGDKMI